MSEEPAKNAWRAKLMLLVNGEKSAVEFDFAKKDIMGAFQRFECENGKVIEVPYQVITMLTNTPLEKAREEDKAARKAEKKKKKSEPTKH